MTILSSDILGLSSDYGRIVFLVAEALQGFSAQILTFKISWQAQNLVRLEGHQILRLRHKMNDEL